MRKNSLRVVSVILDTKIKLIDTIPKLIKLNELRIPPKDILELVFSSWLLVEKSYIDIEVNGAYTIKDAIEHCVLERMCINPNEMTPYQKDVYLTLVEVCFNLYIDIAIEMEKCKDLVEVIHDIRIKKWIANDIVIEITYL